MKELPLNKLTDYSPWVARLLGLEMWQSPSRTVEKVDAEYDKDKWARCLDYYMESEGRLTPEDINRFDFAGFIMDPPADMCISKQERLFVLPFDKACSLHYELILKTLEPKIRECDTIVELGCGYGYNLWMLKRAYPDKTFLGGEYSPNAVRLAGMLYEKEPNLTVTELNIYDSVYPVLDDLTSRCLLFTVHAVEQLPSASRMVKTLIDYKDAIQNVVHFEPVYELHGATTLGLMRKRYAQVNDYNRDLMSCLRQHGYIRVARQDADVLSMNPLNPVAIVEWSFQ